MNLQELILQDGIKHGMCEKFQKLLSARELSSDELCALYIRGLDFCIENNWPGVDIISQFDPNELNRNGIYYDVEGRIDAKLFTVINGDSDVTVVVGQNEVTSLYVRNNSKVKIIAEQDSYCYVTCLDNCEVSIVSKAPTARINCSLYGGNIDKEKFDKINYK